MRPPERPSRPDVLTKGEITVKGRLPWSSNGTFLVELCEDGEARPVRAVYKPLRGERPLWDYPPGLYRREIAAYVTSEWLGWGLVPETVERDGPLGLGSLQRFVDADFNEHYFTLLERPEHHEGLKRICAFDLVINSGDRKSGHCLVDDDGWIWAIDNGLSFHPHPKLRTVIWDFDGQPLPEECLDGIRRLALCPEPPEPLVPLLTPIELEALLARAAAILRHPYFPPARSTRAFPWPLV
ncbi:MAG TPA: SCO1664 family protein [Acidimicrobiales bacterium]